MIPLSARLLCIASLVRGNFVCDIGTDHALLPAYLILSGRCDQAIATDIKPGPLNSAKSTLAKYRISHAVTLKQCNGLEAVSPKGITDVVIAGMGGESIRDILSASCAAWVRNDVNLVLQPMSKPEVLRQWLCENGFAIRKELPVRDAHIYSVMQVAYTGTITEPSALACYVGKLRHSDILTKTYVAGIQERLHARLQGLDQSNQFEEAAETRALIDAINHWIVTGKELS